MTRGDDCFDRWTESLTRQRAQDYIIHSYTHSTTKRVYVWEREREGTQPTNTTQKLLNRPQGSSGMGLVREWVGESGVAVQGELPQTISMAAFNRFV